MGDFEDVEAIAENLEMNEREKARYELHKEDIKKYAIRANFWKLWNIIFQIIFFWNIVALALELAQTYSVASVPSASSFFVSLNNATASITFWFGIFSAFAFFLMIYTGIIRSKWEGKLTRSTAYALSFLSNIEHREYMEMEEKMRVQKKTKAMKEKQEIESAKKIIEANLELSRKKGEQMNALKSGKITKKQYEANIRAIDLKNKKK